MIPTASAGGGSRIRCSRTTYDLRTPQLTGGDQLNIVRKRNIWTAAHSAICLFFGFLMLQLGNTPVPLRLTGAVTGYGIASFAFLFVIQKKGVLNLPNFISVTRLVLGAAVLLLLPFRPPAVLTLSLLAVAGLSDTFDGLVARALGPTEFGAKLDMELDAFFMLLLSAILYYSGMEGWTISLGLMRYGYVFLLLFLPSSAPAGRGVGRYEKLVCLLSYLLLITAAAPWIPLKIRVSLVFYDLLLLGSSFLVDLVFRIASLRHTAGEKKL